MTCSRYQSGPCFPSRASEPCHRRPSLGVSTMPSSMPWAAASRVVRKEMTRPREPFTRTPWTMFCCVG
ncbi:hypothetical protein BC629DRAFT_89805 [Irpex lacteus]|nr:hypothetical protein BC629DRAFT_89805 [Irpex lacteus]